MRLFFSSLDNPANTEPNDWMNSRNWAYPGAIGSRITVVTVPLAAVAEMADRVRANNWSADLDEVLFNAAQ